MEDIFSIKVKTKPDTRNLYPSERRYSASTVSGLAWVHIALAATSFVLACLAIVHPVGGGVLTHLTPEDAVTSMVDRVEFSENVTEVASDETHEEMISNLTNVSYETKRNANEYSCILVIAPSLLTVASLAAGIASIMASHHWYVDRNITWLLLMSILSTTVSLIAFVMILMWIANTETAVSLSRFYKDKVPFDEYIVLPKSSIVDRNGSHITVSQNLVPNDGAKEHLITKRVLSINILIACFLEFLWSLLSLKISYKGMTSSYKDEDERRGGNCVAIVTTIKGNTKNPRNAKVGKKPDIINHYPNNNIKQFLNETNSFTNNDKTAKPVNESGSEYRERMMNFLNRCASFDGASNPELHTPSVQSDIVRSAIPEIKIDAVDTRSDGTRSNGTSRVSTISWGDPHDHTIYNQNNLDLGKILKSKIEHTPEDIDDKHVNAEDETTERVAEAEISEKKES